MGTLFHEYTREKLLCLHTTSQLMTSLATAGRPTHYSATLSLALAATNSAHE